MKKAAVTIAVRGPLLCAVLALLGASSTLAGPIAQARAPSEPTDPYELAARWTVATLGTAGSHPVVESAAATPATVAAWTPFAAVVNQSDENATDPGAYALLGAALLLAGLAGRRIAIRQRGFSKKT